MIKLIVSILQFREMLLHYLVNYFAPFLKLLLWHSVIKSKKANGV